MVYPLGGNTRELKLLFWILLGQPPTPESPPYKSKGPMHESSPMSTPFCSKLTGLRPPITVHFCRYTKENKQLLHKCNKRCKQLIQMQKNRLTFVKICGRGAIRHTKLLYYNITLHPVMARLYQYNCMTSH